MYLSLETVAALATILGTAVSIFALFQSREWLGLVSLILVALSVAAILYGRGKRLALDAASTVIEGHSIDSLNIANLRRRVSRTFFIQEAHHTVVISGEDMDAMWKYSGYCRAKRESSIEFGLNSDASTPFADMDCVAFDLGRDPDMKHPIRPVLVGAEGISKRVSVPFLEPLKANQPFNVMLRCTLPRCVKAGFGYYTSTLSFAQDVVPRSAIHLTFVGAAPTWLRVYETTLKHPAELAKTLPPSRQDSGSFEYQDVIDDRPGQSTRVYVFWRETV